MTERADYTELDEWAARVFVKMVQYDKLRKEQLERKRHLRLSEWDARRSAFGANKGNGND